MFLIVSANEDLKLEILHGIFARRKILRNYVSVLYIPRATLGR